MKIRIFRGLALNNGDKINTDRLGQCWTLCENFAQSQAERMADFHGKDGIVVLTAEIDSAIVEKAGTLFCMEHNPDEFEVVVDCEDIEAAVHYTDLESFQSSGSFEGYTFGDNMEDHNDEYEGDLDWNDFLTVAKSFQM